jgi:hypothetical protein
MFQAVRPPGYTWAAMQECSVCRRQFDGRFKVMVPPSDEAFDSIECARQAATLQGLNAAALTPVVLPALVVEPWASPVGPAPSTSRKGIAALAALLLTPSQAALAGGVGLATAGSAAAIYLAARPAIQPGDSSSVVTAMPAPALPFSQRSKPAARPAVRAPLRLAAQRPPDAGHRRLAVGRRSGPAAGYAVVRNVVETRGSTYVSSRSTPTDTQLVSRTVPVTRSTPVSRSSPVAKVAPDVEAAQPPAPRSTPTSIPKPQPKPRPRPRVTLPAPVPPPTGATSKPSNPAANRATRQLVSAEGTPPKGKRPEARVAQAAADPLQQLLGDDGQLDGDHGDGAGQPDENQGGGDQPEENPGGGDQPGENPGDDGGSVPAPDPGGHTVPTAP